MVLGLIAAAAGTRARADDGADPDRVPIDAEPAELPQWGRGPIEVRDPFLLALPRLAPWVRSPETLRQGQVELGLRGTWANSYTYGWQYVVDGEVRQGTVVARAGLHDRVELGLDLPLEWRGGGVMDRSIEAFHDAFDLGQQFRSVRPRDRLLVAGVQRDGSSFDLDAKGDGFADLVTEARVLLLRGERRWPALAATLRLRLPTGSTRLGLSHGVDVSLALDASKRLGPLVLYATLAATSYAHAKVGGLELARHRVLLGAGFEVELGPRVSFVTHAWCESARETHLRPGRSRLFGDRTVSYLAVALKLEPIEGLRLELGALENVITQKSSADFGLVAGISYRF